MTPGLKQLSVTPLKARVSLFMEDDNNWHYRIPTKEEVSQSAQALQIHADEVLLEGSIPLKHG